MKGTLVSISMLITKLAKGKVGRRIYGEFNYGPSPTFPPSKFPSVR